MPEGDTIYRSATSLRRWIGGREVTAAAVVGPSSGMRADAGWDAGLNAGRALVGTEVEAVDSRGKHLLIRFSSGLTLHTHMRMTGSWHLYPSGERWRRPRHRARAVIETGARLAVCFDAPVVELLATAEEALHPSLNKLGPDLISSTSLEPGDLLARAARRAADSPSVGELLLDQAFVAGVGNIYRCESLFICGLDPGTPVASLADREIIELVETAARLMKANAFSGAGFSRSFDSPPDRHWVYRHWVYRRAGLPCRRCATVVRSAPLGREARIAYWCERCQPPRNTIVA